MLRGGVGSVRDFRLGGWLVQPSQCRLTRGGRTVQVRAKVMDLLSYLASRQGEVVSKDQLLDAVWESLAVSESALTHTVAELRQAIGDTAEAPQLIETIPKRGYRLIGEVEYVEAGSGESGAPSTTRHGGDAAAPPSAPLPSLPEGLPAYRRVASPRRGASIALLLSLASLTAVFVAHYGRARSTGDAWRTNSVVRSIAVLPFEDLSEGKGDVQYADGLTEALITELSTLEGLHKVIGRQSVVRFRAAPIPLRDAARALGVDAIVTASVLRSAGRLRVTARLVDGVTERHLWAATYERPDGEVLLIQRQVVEAIAAAIQLALGPEAIARMPKARAVGTAAFDAYIAGRQAVNAGPAHTAEAIGHFEAAAALDPGFAPAQAALAHALWRSGMYGPGPTRDAFRRGHAAAKRSIELDPNLGEAHAALNPTSAMVGMQRAHYLVLAGRYDEAIDEVRRAVELDPSSVMTNANLAFTYFHARRYDESARRWMIVHRLGRDPAWEGLATLTLALAGQGDELRARCAADVAGHLAWRCA
jgi:TolB-like protein/DNA-binding winged helix-turn-helix (wHTH) protein